MIKTLLVSLFPPTHNWRTIGSRITILASEDSSLPVSVHDYSVNFFFLNLQKCHVEERLLTIRTTTNDARIVLSPCHLLSLKETLLILYHLSANCFPVQC